MEALNAESKRLLVASSATSTWATYRTGLNAFDRFRNDHTLEHIWPVPIKHLIMFISFLSLSGLTVSTAKTYIAAINSLHKLNNLPCCSSHFLIAKLLEGFKRGRSHSSRTRAPITFPLLVEISGALHSVCHSSYEISLFKAAFSLAFFGLLRISEFALATKFSSAIRVLQLADVNLIESRPPVIEVKVRFSKTDQHGHGAILKIIADQNSQVCPFVSLAQNAVVTRDHFSVILINPRLRVFKSKVCFATP
jgi:hypothetical protein